jgi:cytochrome c biogenesis protein CcmG, thiol:disulfide interchange protein DsbE
MGVSIRTFGRSRRAAGRIQTIIVMGIAILAIGALSWYVYEGIDDGVTAVSINADTTVEPPAVGKTPTAFSGVSYDGKPISLSDYAGKPLWLTFGASWCRDCRVEAADLQDTYAKYQGQGLNVLAVFINDPPADIAGFAKRARLTFPIVADQAAKIGGAYRLVGLPTHIFIGRDGLIKEILIGALSKDEMERAVAAILS